MILRGLIHRPLVTNSFLSCTTILRTTASIPGIVSSIAMIAATSRPVQRWVKVHTHTYTAFPPIADSTMPASCIVALYKIYQGTTMSYMYVVLSRSGQDAIEISIDQVTPTCVARAFSVSFPHACMRAVHKLFCWLCIDTLTTIRIRTEPYKHWFDAGYRQCS